MTAPTRRNIGMLSVTREGVREDRAYRPSRWHSDGAVRLPIDAHDYQRPLAELIREFVLPGHLPASPLLAPGDRLLTMGSCFADELRRHLKALGHESSFIWVPSSLNNTFALCDFIAWCTTGRHGDLAYSYGTDGQDIAQWQPEHEQHDYARAFATADAFVITLGLAEVWRDTHTGGVFWRGIPDRIFDEDRHRLEISGVAENAENVRRIIAMLRAANHDAPIVFTLSPVPLKATFRGRSCLTADSVSKSVLRVALDEVIGAGRHGEQLYYWPSFEIVRWLGSHLQRPMFGSSDNIARHVDRDVVAAILDAFIESFFRPA